MPNTLFDDLVEGNLHASVNPIAGGILLWRCGEAAATKIASFANEEALGLIGGFNSMAEFNAAMEQRQAEFIIHKENTNA